MHNANQMPTKIWSEGPVDTTEMLVKALIE
jgi:hypothetical protein